MRKEWRGKINYLPFYTSDFFGDGKVMMMDGQEWCTYLGFLMVIWNSEHHYKFPDDDALASKSMKMTTEYWVQMKPAILRCLEVKNGWIYSQRLKEEYDKAIETSKKATASANKRWGAKAYANALPTQSEGSNQKMPTECSPSPSPSPYKRIKNTTLKKGFGEEKWGYEKDPGKDLYKDYVYLSKEEYQKLHAKYGPMLGRIIEKLDAWKENKGPKGGHYISDYKAILQWVAPEVEKEFSNKGRGSAPAPAAPRPAGKKNQETDVETCHKCEKPCGDLVDHRGMRLCRECYDLVKPEMPAQLREMLNSIGGKNA